MRPKRNTLRPGDKRLQNLAKSPMHKRTQGQRELDLVTTAELYLKGMPLGLIAQEITKGRAYTLSRQTIMLDLEEIRSKWAEDAKMAFDKRKAVELAKLDKLENEYWNCFEESKKAFTRESRKDIELKAKAAQKKQIGKGVERIVIPAQEHTFTVESRVGDPRYLDGILRCMERRAAIFGLDAPTKTALTDTDGNPYELVIRGSVEDIP